MLQYKKYTYIQIYIYNKYVYIHTEIHESEKIGYVVPALNFT